MISIPTGPGTVSTPYPDSMFGFIGNFLSNFCGPIFLPLFSNNVNVWLPVPDESGSN